MSVNFNGNTPNYGYSVSAPSTGATSSTVSTDETSLTGGTSSTAPQQSTIKTVKYAATAPADAKAGNSAESGSVSGSNDTNSSSTRRWDRMCEHNNKKYYERNGRYFLDEACTREIGDLDTYLYGGSTGSTSSTGGTGSTGSTGYTSREYSMTGAVGDVYVSPKYGHSYMLNVITSYIFARYVGGNESASVYQMIGDMNISDCDHKSRVNPDGSIEMEIHYTYRDENGKEISCWINVRVSKDFKDQTVMCYPRSRN